MQMIQLSPNHQTANNKPSKLTDEQLQNELISKEQFNQINKLNRQKFNLLLGFLMCDKP